MSGAILHPGIPNHQAVGCVTDELLTVGRRVTTKDEDDRSACFVPHKGGNEISTTMCNARGDPITQQVCSPNATVDLEDVFRSYQQAVFVYFLRLVNDRHAAEELTQETFVRACGAALRFRGQSSVRTWLFGIARRVFLEAIRAGLFDRPPEIQEQAAPSSDHDKRIDLERAFASLGLADREALMMVDLLGFRPAEAAAMVGMSSEAFRVRLHRARSRLREAYTS